MIHGAWSGTHDAFDVTLVDEAVVDEVLESDQSLDKTPMML